MASGVGRAASAKRREVPFTAKSEGPPVAVAGKVTGEKKSKVFGIWPNYAHFTDVCMTCEREGKFFMLPDRRCHTTLWSLGGNDGTIRMKQGRHRVFKDRHGGFQYGGAPTPHDQRLRPNGTAAFIAVSYTPLTQPTTYLVELSVVAVVL